MVGIYKITNTITGHAYIGQSVCTCTILHGTGKAVKK